MSELRSKRTFTVRQTRFGFGSFFFTAWWRATCDHYSHVMLVVLANAAEHVDAAIKAAKKPAIE
ncbi:hypothetical protein GFL84_13660 [Rhizobium leguminosarum bv. viciae]|nr:hypothetical protein [Rhizobium leguminosarum bv. viciae]